MQMFSAPLRPVLWKSIALALALIIAGAALLDRLIVRLVETAGTSAESMLGQHAHLPIEALAWLISFAAGVGIVAGSVMLMPAITAFVGGFFADRIAETIEYESYPADPPGKALPPWHAIVEGGKTALLAILVYVCTVPLLLIGGLGAVIFFLVTAWLLGRIYFELAAMRFQTPAQARTLRKRNAGTVYVGGLLIAGFVSIPIVNLATPLFAMTFMVHMNKRLAGKSRLSDRIGISDRAGG